MDCGISDPGDLLSQFHHSTGRPQTGRIRQGLGPALEPRLGPAQVEGLQLGLPPRPPLLKAEEPDSSACRCQRFTDCRCTPGLRKGIPGSCAAPRIGTPVGSSALISSVVIIRSTKPLSTDPATALGRATVARCGATCPPPRTVYSSEASARSTSASSCLVSWGTGFGKGRSRLERTHGQVEAPLQVRKQQPLQQGRSRRMFRGTCALMAVSSHPTPGSISLRLLEGEGPAVRGWSRLS